MNHSLYDNLPRRKKRYAEHNVALHLQLPGLGCVLHRRLGDHFKIRCRGRLGSLLRNRRSGSHGRNTS
jgi:hypothetical protein